MIRLRRDSHVLPDIPEGTLWFVQRALRLLMICDAVKLLERDDCGVPGQIKDSSTLR